MNEIALVAGEPVDDLVKALAEIQMTRTRDGGYRLSGEMPIAVAHPLSRALRRVEADIVDGNTDGDSAGHLAGRTSEQLRADAFTALVLRVQDSIEGKRRRR